MSGIIERIKRAASAADKPHPESHFQCHNTPRLGAPGDR